ncbi:MAG: hypothetical protein ACE5KG_05935 [Nitrososphaerales archaeon]
MAPHMKDPTCGKLLDHPEVKTAFGVYEYAGNKIVFCSKDCHDKFELNPDPHYAGFVMWKHENFRDPVCAKEMEYDEAKTAFPKGYSFPNNGFGISKHKDHVFFFHNEGCKKTFDANPDKYHADWQGWREAKVKEVDGRVQAEGKHELKHLPDFDPEA